MGMKNGKKVYGKKNGGLMLHQRLARGNKVR